MLRTDTLYLSCYNCSTVNFHLSNANLNHIKSNLEMETKQN